MKPIAAMEAVELTALPTHVRRVLAGVDKIIVYHLPLVTRFRGVTTREGLLLHGEAGWGEAAPFWDYDPPESSRWLASAIEAATSENAAAPPDGPTAIRVNVTIPPGTPQSAAQRVFDSHGCATAKIKVADPGSTLSNDCARIEAVADALCTTVGADQASIRVDVNALWDIDQATAALKELNKAAAAVGGLEYAEQPCATVDDLAALRRRQSVPIAADESIRRAADPLQVVRKDAADVAIVKVAPLGGPQATLALAEKLSLPTVVSSALESSVGLATSLAVAARLQAQNPTHRPLACGLATAQLLAADVTGHSLVVEDGHLPARPVTPDLDAVGQLPLPKDTMERWLARLAAMCESLEEMPHER